MKAISTKDGELLRQLIDEKELIFNLEAKYPEKDFAVKDLERILFFAFSPLKARKEYLDSLKENYVPDITRNYIEEANDYKKLRLHWKSVYSPKSNHSLIVSWRLKNDGWKVVNLEKDSVDSSLK